MAAHPDWVPHYVRETCVIESGQVAPKVLGVHIGQNQDADADMRQIIDKTRKQRVALPEIESPPAELTLQRGCLNLGKATYLVRCNGDQLSTDVLGAFDSGMAGGVEDTLWGPLTEEGWMQATMSVDAGGLGLREAAELALPMFVSSRVIARPLVAEMGKHLAEASICQLTDFMSLYDSRTEAALRRWLDRIPLETHSEANDIIRDAAQCATERWHAWCDQSSVTAPTLGDAPATDELRQPGMGIIGDVASEDTE
jgi:hypothetical protein